MSFSEKERINHLIRKKLQEIPKRRISEGINGKAGVLISLIYRNDNPHFLLTRRTNTVATHKGQISFPGGMMEGIDATLLKTALRETEEEIGVDSNRIEILGEFHDYLAITDNLVRPYAGVIPEESEFQPNRKEVAYLLEIPVAFFAETNPVVKQREVRGVTHDVYYYDYNGDTVWGLTARIIRDFIDSCGLD